MAEEKKPKIDLKARLGKTALGGATPAPPPAGAGIPVPGPAPASSPSGGGANHASAPPAAARAVPGPGVPVGPPPAFKGNAAAALDPSNPLAAAIAPQRQTAPAPAAPPQPQRIEVDEMAVQEARKGARKQGLIAGVILAAVVGVVGFIAGGASETNKGRQASVSHAKSLAEDLGKARDQMKTLADKVDAGRQTLVRDHKFPDTLAKDLGGINIDFDGSKLAGVRFSGFSQDTTSGLIEIISSVQSLNDRKGATVNLLSHLQKPITEQLSGNTKASIKYIALLGGPKDPAGNPFAVLAPLQTPIDVTDPSKVSLPAEFVATDPLSHGNVKAPKYAAGPLDKPAGVYVVPKSVDAVCPSETTGQIAQLGSQLTKLVNDIRGEQAAAGGDVITETKPGMLERADKLIESLNKVQ